MNIGDYLLKKNIITKKQREKAELEHEVSGHKFGQCCLDLGYITRTDLNLALKAIQSIQKKEEGNILVGLLYKKINNEKSMVYFN